jgi:fluoroacetyl-CoA thioesterase
MKDTLKHDGVDLISRGRHERFVIDKTKFETKVGAKTARRGP